MKKRMGFMDQEVREAMVGVSWLPLGSPSRPSPPPTASWQTAGNRMGTLQ